jgi:hypothetical protein
MKVEHLTFKGSTVVRDTDDILSVTVEHFRALQVDHSVRGVEIKEVPFACNVTIQQDIAVFDLTKKGKIISSTLCCFQTADKEPVMLYVKDLARQIDQKHIVVTPKEDLFLYSFVIQVIDPFSAMIAGEIELYIYDAIRRGLCK